MFILSVNQIMETRCEFDALSKDLINLIFSFLPNCELARFITLSKQFYSICADVLMKRISIKVHHTYIAELVTVPCIINITRCITKNSGIVTDKVFTPVDNSNSGVSRNWEMRLYEITGTDIDKKYVYKPAARGEFIDEIILQVEFDKERDVFSEFFDVYSLGADNENPSICKRTYHRRILHDVVGKHDTIDDIKYDRFLSFKMEKEPELRSAVHGEGEQKKFLTIIKNPHVVINVNWLRFTLVNECKCCMKLNLNEVIHKLMECGVDASLLNVPERGVLRDGLAKKSKVTEIVSAILKERSNTKKLDKLCAMVSDKLGISQEDEVRSLMIWLFDEDDNYAKHIIRMYMDDKIQDSKAVQLLCNYVDDMNYTGRRCQINFNDFTQCDSLNDYQINLMIGRIKRE